MFIFACTGLAVNLALLFTIGSHCPQCQNNGGGCGDVGMSLMPGGGVGCDDKGCEDKVCEDNDPVAKVLADAHCIKGVLLKHVNLVSHSLCMHVM